MTQPLTGSELLTKVREMPGATKKELARACGYHSSQGNERTRLNAFYAALLDAKGISIGTMPEPTPRGKLPSYKTRVHYNGNLLVGSRYVEQMGYKPGDEFEIRITKGSIRLVPMGHVDTDDEFLEEVPVQPTLTETHSYTITPFPSRLVS